MAFVDTLKSFFGIKSKPLINEPPVISVLHNFNRTWERIDHKVLWQFFRHTPEIVSIISAIVEDVLSDGYYLEPTTDASSGRNYKLRAEEFLERNGAKEQFTSFLFDAFVTGDAYLHKNKVSLTQVEKVVKNVVEKLGYEIKTDVQDKLLWEVKQDEDIFTTKEIQYVAASTMYAQFDEKFGNAIAYKQRVGKNEVTFTPEEIIHFTLLRLDGRFYGFTPLISLTLEMQILADVKDLAAYYFNHGGVPNWMFVMPHDTPDSPNFKRMEQALKAYASITEKYKSLIVTGKEIEVKDLNRVNKDMEFRELAKYITQVMIMTWGMPASRLSELLLQGGNRGAPTSSEGYYRKISHIQDIFEDLINSQLLKEFKVKLRFNRTYKQDEIREVQIDQIKSDTALKLWHSGFVNENWMWKYLNIPEGLRGDPIKPMPGGEQGPTNRQQQLPAGKMFEKSPDAVSEAQTKQSVALQKR